MWEPWIPQLKRRSKAISTPMKFPSPHHLTMENTPSLADASTPSLADVSTPSLADARTPSLADASTLSLANKDTPSLPNEDTPSLNDEDTPSLDDEDTLSLDDDHASTVARYCGAQSCCLVRDWVVALPATFDSSAHPVVGFRRCITLFRDHTGKSNLYYMLDDRDDETLDGDTILHDVGELATMQEVDIGDGDKEDDSETLRPGVRTSINIITFEQADRRLYPVHNPYDNTVEDIHMRPAPVGASFFSEPAEQDF